MNPEALRYLVELAMATRKADHLDALSVASRAELIGARLAPRPWTKEGR